MPGSSKAQCQRTKREGRFSIGNRSSARCCSVLKSLGHARNSRALGCYWAGELEARWAIFHLTEGPDSQFAKGP
jgi:hypothetical protein